MSWWAVRNCVTLWRLRSVDSEVRRRAVDQLARAKNVHLHWIPNGQEEEILFYVARDNWDALERLA